MAAPFDITKLTPLPSPRRIVTANNPSTGVGEVLFDDVPGTVSIKPLRLLKVGFGGVLREGAFWTTSQSPPDNTLREDAAAKSLDGLIVPNGSNCRVTDLAPGQKTPMVRIQMFLAFFEGTNLPTPSSTVLRP
ncbi:hypothetical protein FRC09_003846 [Ceratobasidium sp. 395]|nr:hypothetical protein FRC09_003846 [Ceratobasidium sp. 395]